MIATFLVQPTVAAGSYPVTVSAAGQGRLGTVTIVRTLSLSVIPAGTTSVTGRDVLSVCPTSEFVMRTRRFLLVRLRQSA